MTKEAQPNDQPNHGTFDDRLWYRTFGVDPTSPKVEKDRQEQQRVIETVGEVAVEGIPVPDGEAAWAALKRAVDNMTDEERADARARHEYALSYNQAAGRTTTLPSPQPTRQMEAQRAFDPVTGTNVDTGSLSRPIR